MSENDSQDNTGLIAIQNGVRLIKSERGPSRARNDGAKAATGEILIFMDADVLFEIGTISTISNAADKNIIGVCSGRPNVRNPKSLTLSFIKNFVRATGLRKGMSEVIFCHKSLCQEKGILFNSKMKLGEIRDFIYRARKYGNAKYKYLRIPSHRAPRFSVERYERIGYINNLFFWLKWWLFTQLLKQNAKPFEKQYWAVK